MFSGGPQFNVAILDNQDFFEGILAPLSMTTLDLYYQERYSRTLLFNLFISKIVIKQEGRVLEIPNYAARDKDVDRFQAAIDYVLNLGLATESTKRVTSYGEPLEPSEVSDASAISRVAYAGLEVKEIGWCDLSVVSVNWWKSNWHQPSTSEQLTMQLLMPPPFVN
jgi:hypothetical protein